MTIGLRGVGTAELEITTERYDGFALMALLDHHGYLDTTNAFWLSTLRPRILIAHFWNAAHLSPTVMRR